MNNLPKKGDIVIRYNKNIDIYYVILELLENAYYIIPNNIQVRAKFIKSNFYSSPGYNHIFIIEDQNIYYKKCNYMKSPLYKLLENI